MSAQVSDENGNFDTPPKVIASFSAAQEHSGFRIYFGDFYATKMRISIYSGESLIISDVIENANPVAEIALGAENYDKVIFEFLSTNEPQKGIKISIFVRNLSTHKSSFYIRGHFVRQKMIFSI